MPTLADLLTSRIPPYNLEAERAILGAMLMDPRAVAIAIERCRADDFYKEHHSRMFATLAEMFEASQAIDSITFIAKLRQERYLDEIGGPAAIAELLDEAALTANVGAYVEIVRDKALLRDMIRLSTEVISEAYEDVKSPGEILESAEQILLQMADRSSRSSGQTVRGMMKDAFENLERLYEEKRAVTGLSTGFRRLDIATAGLHPADFVIIAARPSMGKTALAMNIAKHVAMQEGKRVLVFSLEMSRLQLVYRLLCADARVDGNRLRTGHLDGRDWSRLTASAERLVAADIIIDDVSSPTALEIRARTRRYQAEHGKIDLIVVDYLQLMRGTSKRGDRQQDVSMISMSMKALAKELGIPVIALSQLSRAVETRQAKHHKPQLSDLRESGSLEQDADLVLFIYRAVAYGLAAEGQEHIADLIIGKQRNGPIGTMPLAFMKEYSLFADIELDRTEPAQEELLNFST